MIFSYIYIMIIVMIGLFLLGDTSATSWNVVFEVDSLTVHMNDVVSVPFSTSIPTDNSSNISVFGNSSNVESVIVHTPTFVDYNENWQNVWNSSINVTGNFLGNADVLLCIAVDDITVCSDVLAVTVIRRPRAIDTAFTVCIAIFVSIIYINFGCAMDWDICRDTLKKPVGPAIGFFCQFVCMPLLSYGIGRALFPDSPETQLGMFFTGVSPSGGASNIWTILLGGNLNLSVTMTTICTIAAFGMMPLWIFTLGKQIFEKGNLAVPYSQIGIFVVSLVVPLFIGYLIQKKLPRLSRIMVRIIKPFSILLILFIVIFAIVTNLYLFQLFSWQIVVAGMGLPWLGFIFGMVIAFVLGQTKPDITAIAIETGIQNTGIAIFLLRFTLSQPAADRTTVAPVSCAIMTPIPLTILYIAKLIVDHRRKRRSALGSLEKLQNISQPMTTVRNIDASTISSRVKEFD